MEFKRNDENYIYSLIGKNIQDYRKQKGWTQEELAKQSGYAKQFLSNIENNSYQTFSLGTLWKLALVLEVPLYKLCMEETDKNKD